MLRHYRESGAKKETGERPVPWDQQEIRVMLAVGEIRVTTVLGLWVRRGSLVYKDQWDRRAFRDQPGRRGREAHRATQDPREFKVIPAPLEQRETKVTQDHRGHRVQQAKRGFKAKED